MNPLILSILKFLAVSILSGVIALAFGVTLFLFMIGFAIGSVVQIVVGWVVGSIRESLLSKYAFQARLDESAILAANTITVECAGCKTPNSIPIIASERNLFSCRKCGAENTIILSTETALTTNLNEP